jgi:phosphohistidine swiveling domain-containing protein
VGPSGSAADPLHNATGPDVFWTTTNVGEALPGVMTPLGWTLFGTVGDHCTREAFYRTGAYTRAERRQPASVDDRLVRVFYGRPALQVNALCTAGDRLPGTSAEQVTGSVLGALPEGLVPRPTRRHYPAVAARFPVAALATPVRARRQAPRTARWWTDQVARVPGHDAEAALAAFRAAAARFDRHVVDQTIMLFAAVQPMYEAMGRLVAAAGVGDVGTLTGGYGGVPENAVVAALWEAAHGRRELAEVVARFGYHGPLEGEISGRVWREDDAPLRRLMADYRAAGPDADPVRREAARRAERRESERALLAALPPTRRAAARAVLALAARRIPMRGLLKIAFLQALDVCRANARRFGGLAAAAGVLAEPEDVFYLTVDELRRPLGADVADLVAERRAKRLEYQGLRLPVHFRGMPEPVPADTPVAAAEDGVLRGTGVSPGVVEGVARVVDDPTFADVEPGEVLVARTTDPSWSSIMFVSAALVVDIGGALSHAAVVARELGIPCVVNTGVGTGVLRSGDRVRVDGRAGTVEVLGPE